MCVQVHYKQQVRNERRFKLSKQTYTAIMGFKIGTWGISNTITLTKWIVINANMSNYVDRKLVNEQMTLVK